MNIQIKEVPSKNGQKVYYTLEWGKGPGERIATGKFTWANPKTQVEKNYNKEVLLIIQKDQAEKLLEVSSIGSSHIPSHRVKANFLDFYADYVRDNHSTTNRSLSCSFSQFKKFVKKPFLSPTEITENFCERFRKHLLDNLTGETPADYFMRFKRMVKAAYKQGYFRINVSEDVKAKAHPTAVKDVLEIDDYKRLLTTFCPNNEVRRAAITSMYTGLRWCDASTLRGWQVKEKTLKIKQSKTGEYVDVPLHPVARLIIGKIEDPNALVFKLPTTNNGANDILRQWVWDAKIDKYITWHCLRHTVSDIMQSAGVHVQTVAAMLGQTTVRYLLERYTKRVRQRDTVQAMEVMPDHSAELNLDVDGLLEQINSTAELVN